MLLSFGHAEDQSPLIAIASLFTNALHPVVGLPNVRLGSPRTTCQTDFRPPTTLAEQTCLWLMNTWKNHHGTGGRQDCFLLLLYYQQYYCVFRHLTVSIGQAMKAFC
ncbi:MAG: hypothetical protein P4M00_20145 [Azospirillaceae bacterium]|nr:hypothetical protein [Azospirillaceae bacterium]